jgi:hypothetical protein
MRTLVCLSIVLSFCACDRRDDPNRHYQVERIAFCVPKAWRLAQTSTPATKLCLHIPDGKGGASALIKVDIGRPVLPNLKETVQAMEKRFNGTSAPLNGSVFTLTTTASTNTQLPRYIYTAMIDGRVYFVFVSADDAAVADAANAVISSTMTVAK